MNTCVDNRRFHTRDVQKEGLLKLQLNDSTYLL